MKPQKEISEGFERVSDTDTMSDSCVATYWAEVSHLLIHVFKQSATAADAAINSLRTKIDSEAEPPSQLFFYHLAPLQVAADLGGARDRSFSEEERRIYLNLRNEGRFEGLDLKTARHPFPEDSGFH